LDSAVICPVCLSTDGYSCSAGRFGTGDATLFDCDVCGRFALSRTVIDDYGQLRLPGMTKVKRASLSHQIRLANMQGQEPRIWTTYDLEAGIQEGFYLPTPAQQATNIIRYIGDRVTNEGEPIDVLPREFSAVVGSPSKAFAYDLLIELINRGLVTASTLATFEGKHIQDTSLTLSGWHEYEDEKKGNFSGSYGFIALKFGDPVLDPFLRDYIKPAVQEVGYDLVDLRDVARAGIIDNLLRVQIRDSAFVLVDLTHENAGAYWEAGYAEGLGKPVLYLCERTKFDERKTHFDTNHCTTVLWDVSETEKFRAELIATIRRSLVI
jgi:hypothetical protein